MAGLFYIIAGLLLIWFRQEIVEITARSHNAFGIEEGPITMGIAKIGIFLLGGLCLFFGTVMLLDFLPA